MAQSKLHVSDTLSLPLDLAARTQCIFAQKGAGKTYAAMVMTEELLAARAQVVVLDPTGVWWGLQSSADGGKSPYEIVVMGGGHADVPLEPDAGEIVASFLVETGQSVVLDVSQFESQAAQDRFALALATKLYRLKAHDKANVHVFLDEADQFCPMKPQKGQEKLLHAWDLIVRLGRSRGLGLTAISQRPAVVHTNIRNNVDLLTCLRVTGPHDFKALREWTSLHATKEQATEFLESVPTLSDGEAFFWSPAWLKIFQRATVRKKHTFDSSRTPKPGERAAEPKARRAPDLTKLTEQIRASVQRAKASDPKHLATRVRELEASLAKASAAKQAPATKVERVEVPVLKDKQIDRLDNLVGKLSTLFTRVGDVDRQIGAAADAIAAAVKLTKQPAGGAVRVAPAAPPRSGLPFVVQPQDVAAVRRAMDPADPTGKPTLRAGPAARVETMHHGDADAEVGHGGLKRILIALAQRPGLTNRQIGVRAGMSSQSGTFRNYLSRARVAGWIRDESDRRFITEAGALALGDYEPLPTGAGLLAHWLRELGESGAARMLRAFGAAYPDALTNEQLGEATGMSPASGTFRNYMSRLRTLELIQPAGRGMNKASDELFE